MDEYKRRRRRSRAVMSMFLDSLGGSIDNVDVATFDSDGSDLKALIVGIEPIQDLHGYDNPWPAGGGNNLFNYATVPDENKYVSALDGGLVTPGSGTFRYSDYISVIAERAYYFGFTPYAANVAGCAFYNSEKVFISGQSGTGLNASGMKFTAPASAAYIRFCWRIDGGYDTNWQNTVYFVLNADAHEYSPYSNICPISGRSSVNVIVSPTLNPLDGTITNIPLGTTVYGGTLDVLTGVLTDANANIASYNGESINEPWISSMDAYSPGATPTTGAQVVYPLATPQIIQLTGQQIATFLGTNNVWCDSGKIIHLEY